MALDSKQLGIQMNWKEVTKTVMIIANWKKTTLVSMVYTKIFQRFNPLTAGVAYIRVFIY